MGSAVEAEVGGLYQNCQHGEEFRMALQETGHPQPPMIVITDNSTAEGIVQWICNFIGYMITSNKAIIW
eukprot:15364419-Ditylum_brightwellii.AAC.1